MKTVIRDKEGHYIIPNDQGINPRRYNICNIFAPNIKAYIKEILTDTKGEINSNTIIVGDFNIPMIPKERSSRQKINKETLALRCIRSGELNRSI